MWASEHALERIKQDLNDKEQTAFTTKMIGFSEVGYWRLSDRIVRHEGVKGGRETWRVAYKNSSLFRVVGFFEEANKRDFIALDAFFKDSADDYSTAQWNRMSEISEIKRQGGQAWQKTDQ